VSVQLKRWLFLGVALLVLLVLLTAQLQRSGRVALAQDPTFTPTLTPSLTPTPTLIFTLTPTPTFVVFGTPTPTWTPFVFGTPTVVPTPTRPRRIVTEISSPQSGDAMAGFAPIEGSALKTSFRSYEISIAPAGTDAWSWLISSMDIISEGILYYLDTTAFPDGFYDLRLRAVDDLGNYEDDIVRGVEIRNAFPPTPTPRFNAEGTLLPPPPISPLGPPTATPRPRIVANLPSTGQGIFFPEVGDSVSGLVDIIGTVNGAAMNPFVRYEMALSAAGMDAWEWLFTNDEQFWLGTLYTLDTRAYADGRYDIRLRIVYVDGNYDDFIVRYVHFANEGKVDPAEIYPNGIYAPKSHARVGGIVDFVGTATDPSFLRWELAWSPAGAEQWSFLYTDDRQLINQLMARLDLSKLAESRVDFRLRVVRQDYNYDEFFVRGVQVLPPTPVPTVHPTPEGTPTPTPLG
jgi:hypothetical protein